ncbi:MAG TPA: hypothetical protein PKX06_02925 [Phenylobacterium sp.]|nr:hypothetical protein [Phenylobacterium sp.]
MDASQIPTNVTVVTPSDTDDANGCGFVYSGGACAIVTASGATVTMPEAFAGVIHPVQIRKVLLTGTTATSVAVYR